MWLFFFAGFQPIMTVVSAVSEKPKVIPPLSVGTHGSSPVPTPTPDVAFLGGTQHSTMLVTEVEDTTAFLKEAERTARNEVQV